MIVKTKFFAILLCLFFAASFLCAQEERQRQETKREDMAGIIPLPTPQPTAEFYLHLSRDFLSLFPSLNREVIREEGESVRIMIHMGDRRNMDDPATRQYLHDETTRIIVEDLADRLTRAFEAKEQEGREALAGFYADICIDLAGRDLDFDDPLGNDRNWEAHRRWALGQPPSHLKEVLIKRVAKLVAWYDGYLHR